MSLEITCMLIVSYIFMFGELTSPFFKDGCHIIRLVGVVMPKIFSILILYHVVTKYLLKLK